ncbi:MAG TPA: hypothetical protein VKW06_05905 [Candidatus Angelobacter sp.]|nr:hypothetical protein [Candidatus Angelobacter sp.]
MKIALALAFVAGLAASPAIQAQKLDPDGKEAIPYVREAVDIAGNVQQGSLNNFLAVFVTYRDSDQAAKDGDLGPFMKVKEAIPIGGRTTVCLFSPKKDDAICVYFDDKKPFGLVAVKAGTDGKFGDANDAYRRVTREMLQKPSRQFKFTEQTVTTDYGAGLTGFQITTQ